MKKKGIYYYCNIASPVVLEDNTIKFIDYDLDLRVFPDGRYRILDRDEFNEHKKEMNYSEKLSNIINYKLSELIKKYKNKEIPFNNDIIEKYKNEYFNIIKEDNFL